MLIRAISYGGGVQSTALLVLAARGEIEADVALFANVGDDSEHPDTLRYVREVAAPYAERHGIALHELARRRRDGAVETLYERLMRPSRTVGIPLHLAPDGAPGNRSCTGDFKVKVLAKWLKQAGATACDPATSVVGISFDEATRMRSESGFAWIRLAYPLVDRRMTRADCAAIIDRAGLPVPPKSSCWFCPFHGLGTWRRLRNEHPDLFERAVTLERTLNARQAMLGREPGYLSRKVVPLDRLIGGERQAAMFEDDSESGSCGPFVCAGGAA